MAPLGIGCLCRPHEKPRRKLIVLADGRQTGRQCQISCDSHPHGALGGTISYHGGVLRRATTTPCRAMHRPPRGPLAGAAASPRGYMILVARDSSLSSSLISSAVVILNEGEARIQLALDFHCSNSPCWITCTHDSRVWTGLERDGVYRTVKYCMGVAWRWPWAWADG